LPSEYAQAFSGDTTADSIKSYTSIKVGPVDLTGAVCSDLGLAIGLVTGVAAIVAAAPTGGGSLALYAGGQTAAAVGTAGIIYMLHQQLLPIVEDKAVVPDSLSGPLGGNLLAYGFRELANIDARSSGGVAIDGTETNVVSPAVQAMEDQGYRSKSIFARIFDPNDYRSLTGKLIDNTSPYPQQDISNLATSLAPSKILNRFGSIFWHKTSATIKPYNWGFKRYGIPESVAANPQYDDPYDNAQRVAKLLLDKNYINRAKACFGVDINRDGDNDWQVLPTADVNPNSSDYSAANCSDTSENWQRVMLFVFDSRTMDAAACYLGDDQSCSNTGINGSPANPADSSSSQGGNTGNYQNPLRDIKSISINRIDQGVDYAGTGPVYAVGNGKVNTVSTNSGWPGGVFINYTLTDGPAAGKNVFVAEGCLPQVKTGQSVTSATVICGMIPSTTGIEMGWAADPSRGTIAAAYDVYQGKEDGDPTAYGKNFSDFMKSFGGPPGDISKSSSTTLLGTLPAGWPTW
jgi:hypothetical protein